MSLIVGTAAWNLPKEAQPEFPLEGTHLQRYAAKLRGVEINSSFYREHKAMTYKKWADSVPEEFQFSVKLAKTFTHLQKLDVNAKELKTSLQGIRKLGKKWQVLLVQLPPSLAYNEKNARRFFSLLRSEFNNMIAFEPRHKTWLIPEALELFHEFHLTKVFADPEPCPLPKDSAWHFQFGSYFRLHGRPEIYKSNYEPQALREYYSQIVTHTPPAMPQWCIFDNTTFGYATLNALQMAAFQAPPAFKKTDNVLNSANA